MVILGRPRKNRVDHSYEKPSENQNNWEVHVAGQSQVNSETATPLAESRTHSSTTGELRFVKVKKRLLLFNYQFRLI